MPWTITVQHIGVGAGDSALLGVTDGTDANTKTVLIDAGKSNAGAGVVLTHLREQLGIKKKPLDAIVITHYDNDHYGGLYFHSGGLLTSRRGKNQPVVEWGDFFIPDMIKNPTSADRTCLYDQGSDGSPYSSQLQDPNVGIYRYCVSPSVSSSSAASLPDDTFANRLLGQDILWRTSGSVTNPFVLPSLVDQTNVNKDTTPDNVVFSLAGMRAQQYAQAAKIGQNSTDILGKPALFCIGINEHILVHPNSSKSASVQKTKTEKPSLGLIPDVPHLTPSNTRSIALILVSPADQTFIKSRGLSGSPGQILYYMAGDLGDIGKKDKKLFDLEVKIANWLKSEGYGMLDANTGVMKRIYGMKLGHHGATNATPAALIDAANPMYTIISAGTKHFHPAPEIIAYIGYRNALIEKNKKMGFSTTLLAMCPPYYLYQPYLKNFRIRGGRLPDAKKPTGNVNGFYLENFLLPIDSPPGYAFFAKELTALAELSTSLAAAGVPDLASFAQNIRNYTASGSDAENQLIKDLSNLWMKACYGWPRWNLGNDFGQSELETATTLNAKGKKEITMLKYRSLQFKSDDNGVTPAPVPEVVAIGSDLNWLDADDDDDETDDVGNVVGNNGNTDFSDAEKKAEKTLKQLRRPQFTNQPANMGGCYAVSSSSSSSSSKKVQSLFLTDASSLVLAPVGATASGNNVYFLSSGSSFEQFVSALPAGILYLSGCDYTISSDQKTFTLNQGTIDNQFKTWLQTLNFGTLTLQFSAQLNTSTPNQPSLNVQTDTFSAQLSINQGVLSVNQTSGFVGKFQPDNTILFTLPAPSSPSQSSTVSLLKAYGFIQSVGGSQNAVFLNNLQNLLSSININSEFPLVNTSGSGNTTNIVLSPSNYNIDVSLVASLSTTGISFLKAFTFTNSTITFSNSSYTLNDDEFRQDSKYFLDTSLTVTLGSAAFPVDIRIWINNDGRGSFTFIPPSSSTLSSTDILNGLSQLLGNVPSGTSLSQMVTELDVPKAIAINSSLRQVSVFFDLNSVSLSSVEFIFNIQLFNNYTFLIDVRWPYTSVRGRFLPTFTGSPDNPSFVPVGVTTWATDMNSGVGVALPKALQSYNLDRVSFNAYLSQKSYSLRAEIGSVDGSPWQLNSQITLENIILEIVKNNFVFSAYLSAYFDLNETRVVVSAECDTTNSAGKTWLFSCNISYISLENITALIQSLDSDIASLPAINLQDIALQLTVSDVKTEFQFNGNIDIGSQVFSVACDSSKTSASSIKYITASWSQSSQSGSGPLKLSDITQELGLSLPIPSDLDIGFQSAEFIYYTDTSASSSGSSSSSSSGLGSKILAFKMEWSQGGNPIIAQLLMYQLNSSSSLGSTPAPYQSLFWLEYDFNSHALPALPVIGSVNLPLDSVQFLFTTAPLSDDLVKGLNTAIAGLNQVSGDSNWSSALLSLPDNLGSISPFASSGCAVLLQPSSDLNNGQPISFVLNGQQLQNPGPFRNRATVPALREWRSTALSSSDSSNSVYWVNVNKSLGPLRLNRFGVGYQSGSLQLPFDVDVTMGGLDISLTQLSLSIPLNDFTSIGFSLQGMGLDYSAGGTFELGGSFLKASPAPAGYNTFYSGSAVLSLESFNLAAAGFYGTIGASSALKASARALRRLGDDSSNAPTVFVFGRTQSNEPFGGPPYCYVTALSGGFGYNQHLRLPSQNDVVNFPFIEGNSSPNPAIPLPAAGDLNGITALVNNLMSPAGGTPWLTPSQGEDFLAFGIDFDSFGLVHSKALFTAQFGKDLVFALLGRSVAQLPPVGDDPLAYVEMGIEAIFRPENGTFSMTAVLSPNSYVLDKACVLTGGFAFSLWFEGEHEGDFVVTLGGYHPSFNPPAWYPLEPRLGFNWAVSDEVSISGEAYFALTPSCVMEGGALQVLFHSGDLRAWFQASADFLIEWMPFYCTAEVGVDVGASYRMNLLFTSTTLEVELGADLELWGPPLGGEAHVDWWVISFTVGFGASRPSAPTWVDWAAFKQALPNKPSATQASPYKLSINSGLVRQEQSTWIVRGDELAFQIESAIPLNQLTWQSVPQASPSGIKSINIKPMGISVQASSASGDGLKYNGAQSSLSISVQAPTGSTTWQTSPLTRNVPAALWSDPTVDSAPGADTVPNQWVGLSVQAPPAILSNDSPGPMVMSGKGSVFDQTFIEDEQGQEQDGLMPLQGTAVVDSSVTTDPQATSNIAKQLASSATQAQRTSLFQYLQKSQYLLASSRGNQTDSMSTLAATAAQEWDDQPLMRNGSTKSLLRRNFKL